MMKIELPLTLMGHTARQSDWVKELVEWKSEIHFQIYTI